MIIAQAIAAALAASAVTQQTSLYEDGRALLRSQAKHHPGIGELFPALNSPTLTKKQKRDAKPKKFKGKLKRY